MPVRPLLRCLVLVSLAWLSGCGGGRSGHLSYEPGRTDYPAPGSEDDPWGPYIQQASGRFGVPAQWIRAVMHQESGGHEYLNGAPITSSAGAMGLMQLMPATYADLQSQYGLGSDPFDPHDNIMAGTGYIRKMYDKYGSPGFLAAYNAGPARVDDYLAGDGGLPSETVNYVASIAPHLGGNGAVAFASRSRPAPPSDARPSDELADAAPPRSSACWHDPNAAYDPSAPCGIAPIYLAPSAPSAPEPQAAPPPAIRLAASAGCPSDPDAAYDAPCPPQAPQGAPPASALGVLRAPAIRPATRYASPATLRLASARTPEPAYSDAPFAVAPYSTTRTTVFRPAASVGGAWAIQVGAFGRPAEALFANTMARNAAPASLGRARDLVMTIPGMGGHPLYRARLAGLDRAAAASACDSLRGHALACMLIPPGA